MNAAFITRTGGPDEIRVGPLPDPVPGPREALVRVRASAVNPIDTYVRSGMVAMPLPMPFVVGCDLAGEVVAVGAEVDTLRPGMRVWEAASAARRSSSGLAVARLTGVTSPAKAAVGDEPVGDPQRAPAPQSRPPRRRQILRGGLVVAAWAACLAALPCRATQGADAATAAEAAVERLDLETTDGVRIAAWHYPAPAGEKAVATVILVHDIEGSHNTVDHLARSLQRAGCTVVAPDLRSQARAARGARAAPARGPTRTRGC